MKSLYQRLTEAGCQTDSHYSDLYVRYDEKARAVIDEYRHENKLTGWGLCSFFISQIDGKQWVDLPFFYEPYWTSNLNQPTNQQKGV